MPPKKNQINGFWLFAQGNKGKWKAQGQIVGTSQQLLAIASPVWKSLSPDERKQWDARAKEERKDKTQNQEYERLDNTGQVISMRRDFMEEARKRREREINETTSQWNDKDMTEEKFYFLNFQDLCEVTEGGSERKQWLPREMAVVEYCLRHGITKTYHQCIWPGRIPLGFRLQAEQKSEEYHKLPIQEAEHDSHDYEAIFRGIKEILSGGMIEGKYPPLYCLIKDYEKSKFICDWLLVQSGKSQTFNNPIGRVHSLEDLVAQLLVYSGNPNAQNISTYQIMRELDGSRWDYISTISCDVHKELDVTRYCALSIVRKIAYTISDMLAMHYNIQLSENHVPVKEEPELPPVRVMAPNWAPSHTPGAGRGRGRMSSPNPPGNAPVPGSGGGTTYAELSQPLSGRESEDLNKKENSVSLGAWGSPWKQLNTHPASAKPEKASSEEDQDDDFPALPMSGLRVSGEPSVGGRGIGAAFMGTPAGPGPAMRPPPGFGAAVNAPRGRGFMPEGASVRAAFPAGRGAMPPAPFPNATQEPTLGRGMGRGAMPTGVAQGLSFGRGRMPVPGREASQFEVGVLGSVGRGYRPNYSATQVTTAAPQQPMGPRWQMPQCESEACGAGRGVSNGMSSAVPSFSTAPLSDNDLDVVSDNFEPPPLEADFPALQSSGASVARGVNSGGMARGVSIGRGSRPVFGRGFMQAR